MSRDLQNSKRFIDWVTLKIKLDVTASNAKNRCIKRGQVYWCDFGINIGSEQEERRPCVILQNDKYNKTSSNTIVAPITHTVTTLSIVVPISDQYAEGRLILNGHVLLGNIVTISKARLGDKITVLPKNEMKSVDTALAEVTSLIDKFVVYNNIIKDKEKYIQKIGNENAKLEAKIKELEKALTRNKDNRIDKK